MGKHYKRKAGVPLVGDVTKFLDNLEQSVEGLGDTIVSWIQTGIVWLRRHKKLAIAVLVLVVAYHWLNNKPYDDEEDE